MSMERVLHRNLSSKRLVPFFFKFEFSLLSVLKVIKFQWQLIISKEKSEAAWLSVQCKLGKVFFNW